MPDENHHELIVSTDDSGRLVITPNGWLDEQLSRTLLQVLAAAVTADVPGIVLELDMVSSFDEHGVRAVVCSRNLSRSTGSEIELHASLRGARTLIDAACSSA